jgi:prepilin-type N-terminal cleavage/methylation domain-containing protein
LVSVRRAATVTGQITSSPTDWTRPWRRAFTLLEVMIAVAFIGIAMLALMSLHRSDLDSVIRAQDLTRAAMLAQQVMSTAEVERFPLPGQTHGDFAHEYRGEFANFRWEREVDVMPDFPDMRRVRVTIFYGHSRRFNLFEYMHNPNPPPLPNQPDTNNPAESGDQADPNQ